jgi:hypothetical protein
MKHQGVGRDSHREVLEDLVAFDVLTRERISQIDSSIAVLGSITVGTDGHVRFHSLRIFMTQQSLVRMAVHQQYD